MIMMNSSSSRSRSIHQPIADSLRKASVNEAGGANSYMMHLKKAALQQSY